MKLDDEPVDDQTVSNVFRYASDRVKSVAPKVMDEFDDFKKVADRFHDTYSKSKTYDIVVEKQTPVEQTIWNKIRNRKHISDFSDYQVHISQTPLDTKFQDYTGLQLEVSFREEDDFSYTGYVWSSEPSKFIILTGQKEQFGHETAVHYKDPIVLVDNPYISDAVLDRLTLASEAVVAVNSGKEHVIHQKFDINNFKFNLDHQVQEILEAPKENLTRLDHVRESAPELYQAYKDISDNHQTLMNLSANNLEKQTQHEIKMNRVDDVVNGYIMINDNSNHVSNADDKLTRAIEAIEQLVIAYDNEVDKVTIEVNDQDLNDFEISLRLLEQDNNNQSL